MVAVVDSGPLYAAVDADDQDHARCLQIFQRRKLDLIVPVLVVAEVTYCRAMVVPSAPGGACCATALESVEDSAVTSSP